MTYRDQMMALLNEHGPMTAREIAEEMNISINAVTAILRRKYINQRDDWHIAGYRRDEDGGRLYPRALYMAGPGVNSPKPKPLSHHEYNKRARSKTKRRVASVFQLGVYYEDRFRRAA